MAHGVHCTLIYSVHSSTMYTNLQCTLIYNVHSSTVYIHLQCTLIYSVHTSTVNYSSTVYTHPQCTLIYSVHSSTVHIKVTQEMLLKDLKVEKSQFISTSLKVTFNSCLCLKSLPHLPQQNCLKAE